MNSIANKSASYSSFKNVSDNGKTGLIQAHTPNKSNDNEKENIIVSPPVHDKKRQYRRRYRILFGRKVSPPMGSSFTKLAMKLTLKGDLSLSIQDGWNLVAKHNKQFLETARRESEWMLQMAADQEIVAFGGDTLGFRVYPNQKKRILLPLDVALVTVSPPDRHVSYIANLRDMQGAAVIQQKLSVATLIQGCRELTETDDSHQQNPLAGVWHEEELHT
ncbi:hypothetical protein FQA39_LY18555 [Lamprigera yunnana]|nr:hypothetical protein FQA39_LY18555 [Lamprigera yunnana]